MPTRPYCNSRGRGEAFGSAGTRMGTASSSEAGGDGKAPPVTHPSTAGAATPEPPQIGGIDPRTAELNANLDRAIDFVKRADARDCCGDLEGALSLRRSALEIMIEELKHAVAEPNSARRRVLQEEIEKLMTITEAGKAQIIAKKAAAGQAMPASLPMPPPDAPIDARDIAALSSMGFGPVESRRALERCRGDLDHALSLLLETAPQPEILRHHESSPAVLPPAAAPSPPAAAPAMRRQVSVPPAYPKSKPPVAAARPSAAAAIAPGRGRGGAPAAGPAVAAKRAGRGVGCGGGAGGAGRAGGSNDTKRRDPLEQLILDEMLEDIAEVRWDDIVGLEYAKQTLQVFLV